MNHDDASQEPALGISHAGESTTASKDPFSQATAELTDRARDATDRMKEVGLRQAEARKENAAETADVLADAVDRASEELHRQNQDGLASYASQVAGIISDFAEQLRTRSVDELLTETQGLAHRSPAAFFLGSVGAGFALSRFLKASSHREASSTGEVGEQPSPHVTEPAGGYRRESELDIFPDIAGASGWLGGMVPPERDDSSRPKTH